LREFWLFIQKSFVFPPYKKLKIKEKSWNFASCIVWVRNLSSHFEEHRLRTFESKVLRKIFGPKRKKDASCRKLHSDGLRGLNSKSNIVRVIKSRRMR